MRCVEEHIAISRGEDEIAGRRINSRGRSCKRQRDLFRMRSRRNTEVVFELSLIAVVHQVDARIDRLILDACKLRNSRTPLCRIAADKVVAPSRQRRGARDASGSVCAFQPHANDRWRFWLRDRRGGSRGWDSLLQFQHGFVGGQKQTITGAARQKFDLRSGLAAWTVVAKLLAPK